MADYILERRVWLPRPRPEVFEFFADPRNLERLHPAWARPRWLAPPPARLAPGAVLDFQAAWLPGRWRVIVREASPAERREMEDFTCMAIEKVLTGFFPIDAYRDLGFSPAQIAEAKAYRRDVAARNDYAVYRKYFKRDMHTSMVNNLARIGLLTERVRPRLAALGIELPAA